MNGDFRRNSQAIDGGFLTLVSAPVNPIISTTDARAHCRVETSDDDAELDGFVASVSGYLDAKHGILGRALITQTWRLSLNAVPRGRTIKLPFPPVQSVSSIKYLSPDGVEQTFAAENYYFLSGGDCPFVELASAASWPSIDSRSGAFWVDYVAGYGDSASDLPKSLVNAAKMMVGAAYENRESEQESSIYEVPLASAMLNTFRVGRF